MTPGVQFQGANLARDEILKATCLLYRDWQRLLSNGKKHFASSVPGAATLQNFDFKAGGIGNHEIPAHPVIQNGPVSNGIFVRLRFVTNSRAMNGNVPRMKSDRAVAGGANDFRAGR